MTTGEIAFRWNGRELKGRRGDTIATALFRQGIFAIGATRKRHLPLGVSGSFVSGSLARVDGRPNVRLDREPLAEGSMVVAQNVWPSHRLDLLRLARLIPAAWIYGGFEHTNAVMSGGPLFEKWERFLAFMAGVAQPPLAVPTQIAPAREIIVDTLVVGGGPAGRAAANAAADAGASVALVTRSFVETAEPSLPQLHASVQFFPGEDVFGVYRGGAIALAAPFDHRRGALVIRAKGIVLATGRRSMPPIVPGNQLPGVVDAHTALDLFRTGAALGGRIVVVGSGAEIAIAERLALLGADVVAVRNVAELTRIHGRGRVRAVSFGSRKACDMLVHAGPWRADTALFHQANADGTFQLRETEPTPRVRVIGCAAEAPERIAVPNGQIDGAYVCACMDVTVGEIRAAMNDGTDDVEVIKRLTSCGMGPCQGFPCWELMDAVVHPATPEGRSAVRRPSQRAPRRAITVAQAAGLLGIVEPE